jgi:hypothetical protein
MKTSIFVPHHRMVPGDIDFNSGVFGVVPVVLDCLSWRAWFQAAAVGNGRRGGLSWV